MIAVSRAGRTEAPTSSSRTPLCLALALLLTREAAAEPFGWRRDGTGRFPSALAPLHWDRLAWSAPMETRSNATPVLVGHRLFVCAEPTTLLCLDARTGKVLWSRTTTVADALTGAAAQEARDAEKRGTEAQQALGPLQQEISRLKRMERAGPSPEREAQLQAAEDRFTQLQEITRETLRFRLAATGDMIGYSSSTPVTDGRSVYQVFANGVATAFSLDGRRRWAVYLGEPPRPMNGFDKGHSASPLIVAGKLIVPFGNLQALDAESGRVVWRSEPYRDYGTPALARVGSLDLLITPDGKAIRATDGKVLARGLASLRYSGPVVSNGVAYFVGSVNPPPAVGDSVEARARAVSLQATPEGSLTTQRLYDVKLPGVRYYASPVVQDGLLYTASEKGLLLVLDAATGATVWQKDLPHEGEPDDQHLTFFPSLALTSDAVVVSGEAGGVFSAAWIVAPGREYLLKARQKFEAFDASPVFAGRRLFLRGHQGVYCIDDGAAPRTER